MKYAHGSNEQEINDYLKQNNVTDYKIDFENSTNDALVAINKKTGECYCSDGKGGKPVMLDKKSASEWVQDPANGFPKETQQLIQDKIAPQSTIKKSFTGKPS